MNASSFWILSAFVVLCAMACSASPDADNDLDGFGFNEDCDDFDPRAYPGADEVCGGWDEDCDGRIDEGLPDLDEDGVLDCDPDRSCEVRAVEPRRNLAEQTCPPGRVEEPWGMRQLWRWEADNLWDPEDVRNPGSVNYAFAIATNREGKPVLYVLALSYDPVLEPALVSLDAATGTVNWVRVGSWGYQWGIAAADLDDDGDAEVVALQDTLVDEVRRFRLVSVDEDNHLEWISDPICEVPCPEDPEDPVGRTADDCDPNTCIGFRSAGGGGGSSGQAIDPVLVRLDGRVKIATTLGVVDGASGAVDLKLEFDWVRDQSLNLAPIVIHGLPDIGTGLMLRWSLYDPALGLVWDQPPDFFGRLFSGVVQTSPAHGLAVSLFSAFGYPGVRWSTLDAATGKVVRTRERRDWENDLFFYGPHGLAVADHDGDGISEEIRGTVHKYGPRFDSTLTVNASEDNPPLLTFRRDTYWSDTPNSLTGFDFDGDGTVELVGRYRDRMFILSNQEVVATIGAGLLGDGLRELPVLYDHQKPTVVADIDDDGHAEIVTHTSTYQRSVTGLAAFEHAGSGWMPAGSNWNQTPFRPEEFLEDGTVVGDPPVDYSLESGTMLNARPIAAPHAELELLLAGSCAASCAGEVRAALRVANHGATVVRAGEVEAVVRDEDGQVVARAPVPPTARREQSELFELVVPDTSLLPVRGQMTIELAFAEPTPQCTTDDDTVTVELPPACAPLR
jgi:hypothetical protein